MLFEWQEVADFAIACKVTKLFYDDELNEAEEVVERPEWVTIRQDFNLALTDYGDVVAMYQVADDGTFEQGFWHSIAPLTNNDSW